MACRTGFQGQAAGETLDHYAPGDRTAGAGTILGQSDRDVAWYRV